MLAVFLCFVVRDVRAQADDQAVVREALQGTFDALNSHDAERFLAYFHPTATYYDAQGDLKKQSDSKALKNAFSAGLRFDLQPRKVAVAMYDGTAVVTNLYEGTMTAPSGQKEEMTNRSTSVWVKEDNRWQLVHYHDSPLTLSEQ